MRDPPALEDHLGRDAEAVEVVPGGGPAAFGIQRRRHPLVGIEVEHPGVAEGDRVLRVVALAGKRVEGAGEDPGARGGGERHRGVGRARVEDDDVLAAPERGQAVRKRLLLVERENDDGIHGFRAPRADRKAGGRSGAHIGSR